MPFSCRAILFILANGEGVAEIRVSGSMVDMFDLLVHSVLYVIGCSCVYLSTWADWHSLSMSFG